jgi:hypothetical protein
MCTVVWPDEGKLTLSPRKQTVDEASPGKKREGKGWVRKAQFYDREVFPVISFRNQYLLPKFSLFTKK